MVEDGELNKNAIVVVPLDRDCERVWNQSITVNSLPTLTCHNRYLFVLSVLDVVQAPWLLS